MKRQPTRGQRTLRRAVVSDDAVNARVFSCAVLELSSQVVRAQVNGVAEGLLADSEPVAELFEVGDGPRGDARGGVWRVGRRLDDAGHVPLGGSIAEAAQRLFEGIAAAAWGDHPVRGHRSMGVGDLRDEGVELLGVGAGSHHHVEVAVRVGMRPVQNIGSIDDDGVLREPKIIPQRLLNDGVHDVLSF